MYESNINNVPFYFGFQTQVKKPGFGYQGRGAIFSRWNTKDISNVSIVKDGWYESSGHEGDFVGVRKKYEWSVNKYRLKLAFIDKDVFGDWYGFWIYVLNEATEDFVGKIRFPVVSSNDRGIAACGVSWLEFYGVGVMPKWHVSIDGIYASEKNKSPLIATTEYSIKAVYSNGKGAIHLFMGIDEKKRSKRTILENV